MEWQFTTGFGASGPQKTALIALAADKTVYLLYVFALSKLPESLITILTSKYCIKVGRGISADFHKLARDFPEFKLPQKKHKKEFSGTLDIGKLAAKKSVVSTASASLASIVASVFHSCLSKEARASDWSAIPYSDSQKEYAALDAYIALALYEQLSSMQTNAQQLSAKTQVGQEVTLIVRNHPVAEGIIAVQPLFVKLDNDSKLGVGTTKTRALVTFTKVLAPDYVLSLHKKTLGELQNNQESFEAVVNIANLRTKTLKSFDIPKQTEPERTVVDPVVIHPPEHAKVSNENEFENNEAVDDKSESSDSEDHSTEDEADADAQAFCEEFTEQFKGSEDYSFFQQLTGTVPSRILADVFHIIDKVLKTIPKKHTLRRSFARAFSETILVPDQGDWSAVSAVLIAKGLSPEKVKAKSPDWVALRVRRFIPEKDVLHKITAELFASWRNTRCSVTKLPMFNAETSKKAESVLLDIQRGWVSDPVGIPLYTVKGKDSNGLNIYHCIRGTNSVEGAVHNPLRRNFSALNASPELADSLAADWRHRHNVDCGSLHKNGVKYAGHYDPWITDDIFRLSADIEWTAPLPKCSAPDTSPLSFASTQEQFGITSIPLTLRAKNNFLGSDSELFAVDKGIYPSRLHLSALKSKRDSIYAYLADAQKTQYAVTPVHTQKEFDLYHKALSPGGDYFSANKKPDFDRMARWWSSHADGKDIFYKLKEHLESHFKTWETSRNTHVSLVASKDQRALNLKRTRSKTHIAHVLPAAKRSAPGVIINDDIQSADPEDLSMFFDTVSSDVSNYLSMSEPEPMSMNTTTFSSTSNSQTLLFAQQLHLGPSQQTVGQSHSSSVSFSNNQSSIASLHSLPFTSTMDMVSSGPYTQTTWSNSDPESFIQFDPGAAATRPKRARTCQVCHQFGCPGGYKRALCTSVGEIDI